MLMTMLSLVEADRTIHVKVHDALIDVALAALSAEPTTIDEWRAAMTRFVDPSVVDDLLARCQSGLATERVEGGHLIVDMTAKLAVLGTVLPEIPRLGNVQTCDGNGTLEPWLPYRIPNDWEMVDNEREWERRAPQRRQQFKETWHVDHRQVLYGRLATWMVKAWGAQANQLEDAVRSLQDLWLMTPRDDLQGQTPRQILMAKHAFIEGDIQDQGQTWSVTGRCPPGLLPSSHAFRFGGFGPHEIILYHEMVVYLLLECERRTRDAARVDAEAEVRHLEQLQQEWLHQGHQALYDQSPAAMIARERARLPAVVPKGHTDKHDDCPICRMMYENGQPMIWQLDNSALDHSFATSFYDSLDDWQESQRQWESLRREIERRKLSNPSKCDDVDDCSVWQKSHTNMAFFEEMPPLEACGVMMFSIGGHMGELIQDLNTDEDGIALCRQLHEAFDDLRGVVRDQEDVWMIQSAVGAFATVLHDVARARTDLSAKCADLEDKLDFLCRRYEEHFGQDLEAAL